MAENEPEYVYYLGKVQENSKLEGMEFIYLFYAMPRGEAMVIAGMGKEAASSEINAMLAKYGWLSFLGNSKTLSKGDVLEKTELRNRLERESLIFFESSNNAAIPIGYRYLELKGPAFCPSCHGFPSRQVPDKNGSGMPLQPKKIIG